MVNKLLLFLNKEMSSLHQAAFLLGSFALLSQILALVRDKLLAHAFGAGQVLDLYYAAFRVPDFIFVTVGSLVSVSVLIPFLVEREKFSYAETKKFIDSVFTVFLFALVIVGTIVFIFLPLILKNVFPGIVGEEFRTLVSITKILLLSPLFLGISNLFGSLTQSHNRFFVYALSPLLYNLGIIAGIIFLFPIFGITGLVWGVILGSLLHMTIQMPVISKLNFLPKITLSPDLGSIKNLAKLSFPRTITLSINHISIFFLLSFASLMAGGSIAVFNLAFNLQSVPLSIIGVSYSLAAFPAMSRFFSLGDAKNFLERFISSARHIVFWSIPFSVFFIVLRAHIVRVILGSGQFDWSDTRLTAAALALFSVSLVFQSLSLLFVRGYYAIGKTIKPLLIGLFSGFSTIILSFFLYRSFDLFPTFRYFFEDLLKVSNIPGTSVLMLSLGFTLGSIINGLILWLAFSKEVKGFARPLSRTFFETFSASVVMGFVIFLSLRVFDNVFSLDTFWGVFSQGFFSGVVGIIFGILTLIILGNQEVGEVRKIIHQKFWKAEVVSPDSQMV